MATSPEYAAYAVEQASACGDSRFKKMFGEYMVYVNDKPLLLLCDSTTYVKMLPCIQELMQNAQTGVPYKGAKEHYILDLDNNELTKAVLTALEAVTPLPKPKKKKSTE